jgi:hypothetical protein
MELLVPEVLGPVDDGRGAVLLEQLRGLARQHLLAFRLEVGRLVFDTWYEGDPARYLSQDPHKDASLRDFARAHADALADLDLSFGSLRSCVAGHLVVRGWEPGLVRRLQFSQIVELSRVADPAARAALAHMTVREGWTVRALRAAATAVLAGRWVDDDPEVPGLQPPAPPPPPAPRLQPGRVVTRVEKACDAFDGLLAAWDQVATHRFSGRERARLKEAVTALEAKVAALKAQLG